MDEETLERLRKALETLATELKADLAAGSEQTATVSLDEPIGRLSRVDAMQAQAMALALKRKLRDRLEMVERALAACAKGGYGLCASCRQPIALARLEAMPETPVCVRCASGR